MEPHDYFSALRKRWIAILALALVGGVGSYLYSTTLPEQYRASSSVFVSSQRGSTTGELVQGSTYTQDLVQSYTQLATMPTVLDPVVQQLGLDVDSRKLAGQLTVTAPLDTVVIEITAVDRDPAGAAALANAVAGSLATVSENLSPKDESGQPAVSMTTVAPAEAPRFAFAPNTKMNTTLGLGGGLAAGVLLAIALQFFDTRIRNETELARAVSVAPLGRITRLRRAPRLLTMQAEPHSSIAEEYRRLRANLEFADVDKPVKSLVVTSAMAGEGKSTVALNLALALAEKSDKVLIIDADLRRPTVAEKLGIEGEVGLTSVLIGRATLKQAIQVWGTSNLQVLTAGRVPPNPNELIESSAFAGLLSNLAEVYDYVIVDAPPLLPVTDALLLAQILDGALVVSSAKSTRREDLRRALASLELVKARVLGVVLNQAAPMKGSSYYGPRESGVRAAPTETAAPVRHVSKLRAPIRPMAPTASRGITVRDQSGDGAGERPADFAGLRR